MKRIDLIKTGGFAAQEHLVVTEVPEPDNASEKEIVIHVKASGINPVDWKMAEYGFLLPPKLPAALGCDVAGIVATTKSPLEGKRVVTYLGANKGPHPTDRGAFVEKVVQDASLVQVLPDNVSFAQAASLPVPAFTAQLLLNELESSLKEGDYVLIWGASSAVGYNAVQLAAKRGWKPIAVASAKHEKKVVDAGAVAFVDYTKPHVEVNVKTVVKDDAKLKGAADCIGVLDTFGTCANLVKTLGGGGTVSTVTPMGLPDAPEGVAKRAVDFGTVLENVEGRALVQKYFSQIVELQALPIRSVKGGFAAETVQEAFQLSKNGVSGEKVVIEWTE